jgi:minor extracellular serine protease Vpr
MPKFSAAIAAVVLCASMMTHAQSAPAISAADSETDTRWLVELSSAPAIEGTTVAALEREETNFHAAARAAGIRYSESRHFRDLFNGLTVRASGGDVARLRSLPGVLAVYPDLKWRISQPEIPPGNAADLITALAQTGADVAQGALGLTGRGVTVAVIDSGIDYDHPDLGGGFGPGTRVTKGFDFVGDAFNADDAEPIVAPDPDPDDCNGHGTHVAGIIGANGGLKGVAPGVTYHAYRVFGCEGTTTSDIMLAAMERAHRDGADVVNMSIGAALQWPQYPTARAADRLVRRGIVVVASAGNEGSLGLYASSAPGIGRDVIGVASFDNTSANVIPFFSISPDDAKIGYFNASGAAPTPTSGSFPMARTGTATTANDACNTLAAGSLAGKVALIRRGTCSFNQKAFNAQSAGAVGVVLYNNVPGFFSPTVAGELAITIPVVAVSDVRGRLIDGLLANGSVTLTWTDQFTNEPNPTGNLLSDFSSYGPGADLSFKPDIGAPGGIIRSTLPLEQGGYGPLSGTSMASPHVAGAVALLLEAHPRLSPREVQERLQNSAEPHVWSGNPVAGFLEVVHRQGAGMLKIDAAVMVDAVVSPSSLALGEIESGSKTRVLRLRLTDDDRRRGRGRDRHRGRGRGRHRDDDDDDDDEDAVTYTLGHQPALSTGPDTFVPAFTSAAASVTFNQPTVTLNGGRRGPSDDGVAFAVTITPPLRATGARVFGGYITLTPDDGGRVLRVPYIGYNGDYQAIPVFTLAGFPLLASLTPMGFVPQPAGASFSLQGDDVPFVLVHLDHQVANLTIEVFDVATGRSLAFADDEDFLPRNSAANTFFAVAWDGTTMRRAGGRARPVPNGTYRLELSVLKALGDPRNPAHFERWTSPNITIARPTTTTTP